MRMLIDVLGRTVELTTDGCTLLEAYDHSTDTLAHLERENEFGYSWVCRFPYAADITVSLHVGPGYAFKHGACSQWMATVFAPKTCRPVTATE